MKFNKVEPGINVSGFNLSIMVWLVIFIIENACISNFVENYWFIYKIHTFYANN